jgi:hypothetical protein
VNQRQWRVSYTWETGFWETTKHCVTNWLQRSPSAHGFFCPRKCSTNSNLFPRCYKARSIAGRQATCNSSKLISATDGSPCRQSVKLSTASLERWHNGLASTRGRRGRFTPATSMVTPKRKKD